MAKKPLKNQQTLAIVPSVEKKDPTPMTLIQMAISSNVDMDKLERLMVMQKEWNAQKAKEAFFMALTAFQEDVPEIKKSRKVDYTSKRTGDKTNYRYATLGDIERQIKSPMRKHGLSKRWEMKEEGPVITITCLVTHAGGHTEKTTMSASLDDSGSKNVIQQKGSTISYLERYSLLAALGIATADTDDDGRSAGDGVDLPPLSDERFQKALKSVRAKEFSAEQLLARFNLTDDQKKALQTIANEKA